MIKALLVTVSMALVTALIAPPDWVIFWIGGVNGVIIGEIL